jgi:hypothetical protein
MLGLKPGLVLIYSVAALLLGMAVYAVVATEWLDARKSPKPFALAVSKNVDDDDRLIIVDDDDPRIWFYLQDKFDLEADDSEGMEKIRASLASGNHVDLLVRSDDLNKFLGDRAAPLYVQDVLAYRSHTFYLLTNDPRAGSPPLKRNGGDDAPGMALRPRRDEQTDVP